MTMEPTNTERAGMNLPPPMGESVGTAAGLAEAAPAQPEAAPQPTQTAPMSGAGAAPAMPSIPLPVNQGSAQQITTNDVSNTTAGMTPAVADDNDLIEKEWVNKAKQIVASTRDDPYQQSKELTVFKADYMQKRYNKTLKLGE